MQRKLLSIRESLTEMKISK
jgi:hypothetical protein